MSDCDHCKEVLVSPLACGGCEAIFPVAQTLSPFEVFGLRLSAHVDRSRLRKQLLKLQRLLHPDFHGQAGETQKDVAERGTAELNAAFEVLRDEAKRASFLVEALGGPSESDERKMPQEFLMEVMDWNETLEELSDEVEGAPADVVTKATNFHAELNIERAGIIEAVLDALDAELAKSVPSSLAPIRKSLNAIRYIDRAQSHAAQIKLAAQAATR